MQESHVVTKMNGLIVLLFLLFKTSRMSSFPNLASNMEDLPSNGFMGAWDLAYSNWRAFYKMTAFYFLYLLHVLFLSWFLKVVIGQQSAYPSQRVFFIYDL